MIPLSKPYIEDKEITSVIAVLKSGNIVQGKYVSNLEKIFSKICGLKYSIAVNNGTSALHTALSAIGLSLGDEVISTPFTFIATANAIKMTGATPIFCDIDENTYNIDCSKIEKLITKNTKAILAVNLYGQPADYREIMKIAKKYSLYVIEDAAQSVGASYYGRMSGNLSDMGCFSLYATKNIMCGEGGVVTTNKLFLYKKAIMFRQHGQDENKRYYYKSLGYNYRMMDLQAAIALEQIKKLDRITQRRQKIAELYNNAFNDITGLITPFLAPNRTHVYHQYTLRITNKFKLSRERLKEYLHSKGISSNVYYPLPLYRVAHLFNNQKPNDFPITEKISKQVLSIPVNPLLTNKEVNYIIKCIKDI